MKIAFVLPIAALLGCASTNPSPPPSPPAERHSAPNAAHHGKHHHRHHRFDNAEQWAEQFDAPTRDAWQKPDAVIDFIAPAPDAVIADVGAGTGYFAVRFAQRVPSGTVLANDVEPDMVRYLGERAEKEELTNIVAVQGTADDPKLPQPADVVFMCDVYHHLADPAAYMKNTLEQLRPGGRVVIVDFKKDAPDDAPGPPRAMRLAQDDLVAQLDAAGLALQRADRDTLPYQYVLEFVAK